MQHLVVYVVFSGCFAIFVVYFPAFVALQSSAAALGFQISKNRPNPPATSVWAVSWRL